MRHKRNAIRTGIRVPHQAGTSAVSCHAAAQDAQAGKQMFLPAAESQASIFPGILKPALNA